MHEAIEIIQKQVNAARLERENAIQEQGRAGRLYDSYTKAVEFHDNRVGELTNALGLLTRFVGDLT